MGDSKNGPKSASIALLMTVLGVSIFVSVLVFEFDSDWLANFLIGACFFSLAGFFVGIYSLLLKRSASGLAAVLISVLMIMIFIILVLLFRDMCIIC